MFQLPLSLQDRRALLGQIQEPGKVFVYPTETFYALGCLATDDQAIAEIYRIKERSSHLPLLVLISDFEQLAQFGQPLTAPQTELLHRDRKSVV